MSPVKHHRNVPRREVLLSAVSSAYLFADRQRLLASPNSNSEVYELTVCPWTPQNPRNDNGLVLPLSGCRLLLVWSEYYVRQPSRSFRTAYSRPGNGDAAPCQSMAKVSTDGGRTWSGKITLQENFGVDNVKHPNLLRLPSDEILFFFTTLDHRNDDGRIYFKRSSDECESWTTPVQISPPGGFHLLNHDHVFLHTSGRIILPAYWSPSTIEKGRDSWAFCFYSDDEGRSWKQSDRKIVLPKVRGHREPAMVELRDGSLLAYLRTPLGRLYKATSFDRGENWSEAEPTDIVSAESMPCLKRYAGTEDLLLIWNQSDRRKRERLTSAISKDEGKTWSDVREIEYHRGYQCAYPSVTFVNNEAIVTYYHGSEGMADLHQELKLKVFREDWFRAHVEQSAGFRKPSSGGRHVV